MFRFRSGFPGLLFEDLPRQVFGCHNRELVLLVHRIPFARRFWELMEFDSRRLGFPASAFDF
ncbi:hypothetical protein F2Q69_00022835 [Brassica cretica]|uniref:Uncharacterized protein n=1 Tax=Brassica cretica TaxID=69181 RepID=A0A8S9Q5Y3_BRACR|nr:hypothetical protein F2Q69_00022835 [Brassica cretica]